MDRAAVARAMSDRLGEPISPNMLNAYASPAREAHTISAARYFALMAATADRRLAQLMVDPIGWAVVEGSALPLIELAHIEARQAELSRRAAALRGRVRRPG